MDSTFKSPLTSISIGPGIRGIERGAERVTRLEHLAYVEIEAFIVENLVAEMELGLLAPAVIWSDAKTCRWEIFRGIVDILFSGYPCQPFSTAGKRRGAEDPRHLYPYIERAIRIIRPRICFFENVRGHVTSGLPEVIASLEGLGYRVHWGIYSAEETGAAHKRERVFIMAYSEGAGKRRREGNFHQANGRPDGELPLIADGAGSENMANAGLLRSTKYEVKSDRIEQCSQLADSRHLRYKPRPKDQSTQHESAERAKELLSSSELGYTNNPGLQGWLSGEREEHSGEWTTRANGPFARVSGPGEPQHEWEFPRTTITDDAAKLLGGYSEKYPEAFQSWQIDQVTRDGFTGKVIPALDVSAHGYSFREDILRALGNSVYEDTAELAFRDLIRKHGIAL